MTWPLRSQHQATQTWACRLLAGALLTASASAYASWPDLVSLGARSPALGGTGIAHAEGFEATYQNPSALWAGRRTLSVGFVYGGARTQLQGSDHAIDDTTGVLLGGSVPLPLQGAMKDRLGLALGLYLPTGVVNRARVPFPEEPRAALLDTRTQVVSVLLGGGVRLPAGFSLGGGVLALAALVGEIVIGPDGTGRITSVSQQEVTVDYTPILGLRWQSPQQQLAIGAVYRGVSRSSYNIQVRTELGSSLPLVLPVIFFAGTAQYDPQQAGLEVAVRPTSQLLLAVQGTWKRWSQYAYPIKPATAQSLALPDPNFHDTVVPRVALEWTAPPQKAVTLQLRAGYFFEWSPTPDPPPDTLAAQLYDGSRHVLTAGGGLALHGRLPLHFDLFGQVHILSAPGRMSGLLGTCGAVVGLAL